MPKNKLKKFLEINSFKHVKEPKLEELNKGFKLKGKWNKDFFNNNNPIVLELGCGKGEYAVGLAKKYPNKNFIGVDIKGARIWTGAKEVAEKGLSNVGFLRTRIDWIDKCFNKNEVDEIWITFPDPQLKKRRAKKRLTHPLFLIKYHNILKNGGIIHLKTDSQFLYGFTLGVIIAEDHVLIDATDDLYNDITHYESKDIKTHYENIFLGKDIPITYLKFRINY